MADLSTLVFTDIILIYTSDYNTRHIQKVHYVDTAGILQWAQHTGDLTESGKPPT
jgi:hypothetical protein